MIKKTAAATRGAVKSKIVYLGLTVAVLGYIEAHKELVAPLLPESWQGIANMALGVAIIVARFFTGESLVTKGETDNENETPDDPTGV